jgi:RHS repeat-associated protein
MAPQNTSRTMHAYDRDKLARLLHDRAITRAITLADDIDGLVRRLSTAYTLRGQLATVSSHDDPTPGQGNVLNEVALSYNALRCLTADRQSHDGAVGGGTPAVQYQCTGGQDNTLRRTGIIYPDGRQLGLEYGAAGTIDDALNRMQSLHDETTLAVIAEWEYLGIAMAARTTLPQPGLQRRWTALPGEAMSDGGDPYVGYDRFGRTQRSLWLKDTGTELQPLSDIAWGYDQASLRTWRRDSSPGAPEEHQDQHFSYDELYQLTQRQRGTLNVNKTAVNGYAKEAEDFGYDQQGNWLKYQTKEDGQPVIDQHRAHNESNQITKIDSTSAIIAHDANGNMTLVPTGDPNGTQGNLDGEPLKAVWDAWNRLRKVYDETDQLIQENHYDALTRRIISDDGTTPRHYYYNDQWRCVEESLGTSTTSERQHIWNPSDRWDLIVRGRDTTTDGILDEHLYCLKDDLDPVAIANATGQIVERFAYSAFGMASILTPGFEPRPGNDSDFDWNFLFHAEFQDQATGWMNYGYRYHAPELGRWLSRDPIGEEGGLNLYGFVGNGPIRWVDYLGLRLGGGGAGVVYAPQAPPSRPPVYVPPGGASAPGGYVGPNHPSFPPGSLSPARRPARPLPGEPPGAYPSQMRPSEPSEQERERRRRRDQEKERQLLRVDHGPPNPHGNRDCKPFARAELERRRRRGECCTVIRYLTLMDISVNERAGMIGTDVGIFRMNGTVSDNGDHVGVICGVGFNFTPRNLQDVLEKQTVVYDNNILSGTTGNFWIDGAYFVHGRFGLETFLGAHQNRIGNITVGGEVPE